MIFDIEAAEEQLKQPYTGTIAPEMLDIKIIKIPKRKKAGPKYALLIFYYAVLFYS